MSLPTRCPRRSASTCAHRTFRRWGGVRRSTSSTTNEAESFQRLRTELLNRKPVRYSEALDKTYYRQFISTIQDFPSRTPKTLSQWHPGHVPVSSVLSRFNPSVPDEKLLPDGTDPGHSPGDPWSRRMWAGGAVRLNPYIKHATDSPFSPTQKLLCHERIKDVQLRGTGVEAKIIVTIERSYCTAYPSEDTSDDPAVESIPEDWKDVVMKEDRDLVFLKAKTAAELDSTVVPKYLEAPIDPDVSYTLTPTQSLLFRYSALTLNAHRLHLDRAYARNVEGHRNLLVHGPLTLTLMLQALGERLRFEFKRTKGTVVPRKLVFDSIEYRNLAPLYCDEEMRVCMKFKKSTTTGVVATLWIEGPTGGMAVKATVRTVCHSIAPLRKGHSADVKGPKHSPSNGTIVGAAVKQQVKEHTTDAVPSTQQQKQNPTLFSRRWRMAWMEGALPYLYSSGAPLLGTPPQKAAASGSKNMTIWMRVRNTLPYLYGFTGSPLLNLNTVHRTPLPSTSPLPTRKTSPALDYLYCQRGGRSALVHTNVVPRAKTKGLRIVKQQTRSARDTNEDGMKDVVSKRANREELKILKVKSLVIRHSKPWLKDAAPYHSTREGLRVLKTPRIYVRRQESRSWIKIRRLDSVVVRHQKDALHEGAKSKGPRSLKPWFRGQKQAEKIEAADEAKEGGEGVDAAER